MPPIDPAAPSHRIGGDRLRATIARKGAELVQLGGVAGVEVLWQGVEPWPRHAPNLFPIVGMLAGDTLRHGGKDYTVTQHGFARDHDFTWMEATPSSARLELRDNAATRTRFPFAFRLEISYAVLGNVLEIGGKPAGLARLDPGKAVMFRAALLRFACPCRSAPLAEGGSGFGDCVTHSLIQLGACHATPRAASSGWSRLTSSRGRGIEFGWPR